MERILKKIPEWVSIDTRLCLVKDFQPIAKIDRGKIIISSAHTPYCRVRLKCEDSVDDIIGNIAHKTDFAMLWAAFNKQIKVPGTRVEIHPYGIKEEDFYQNHEVSLVWTQKRFYSILSPFNKILPHLIVMVSKRDAFNLVVNKTFKPELQGEARAMAEIPLITWTPIVMKR